MGSNLGRRSDQSEWSREGHCYDLYVLDEQRTEYTKAARLCDGRYTEDGWYYYRIEAISEETESLIRDPKMWFEWRFDVASVGCEPLPPDKLEGRFWMPGGHKQFCKGERDGVPFKYLRPPGGTTQSNTWSCLLVVLLCLTLPLFAVFCVWWAIQWDWSTVFGVCVAFTVFYVWRAIRRFLFD